MQFSTGTYRLSLVRLDIHYILHEHNSNTLYLLSGNERVRSNDLSENCEKAYGKRATNSSRVVKVSLEDQK